MRRLSVGMFLSLLGLVAFMATPQAAFASTITSSPEVDLSTNPAPTWQLLVDDFENSIPEIASSSDAAAANTNPGCQLSAHATFNGIRAQSGNVAGAWKPVTANVTCTPAAVALSAQANLYYNNVLYYHTALGQCDIASPSPCTSATARSPGTGCGVCNGYWFVEGHFRITLAPGYYFTHYAGTCSFTASTATYDCTIRSKRVRV